MIKKILSLISIFFLAGCAYFFDNSLPSKRVRVNAEYLDDGTVRQVLSEDIDISNHKIYDSKTKKKAKRFLVGDDLIVYSKNEKIDHILVDSAKTIKLSAIYEPGGPYKISFYSDIENVSINQTNIEYIIDKNNCYSSVYGADDKITYYGTYREEDCIKLERSNFQNITIILLGVYSYSI